MIWPFVGTYTRGNTVYVRDHVISLSINGQFLVKTRYSFFNIFSYLNQTYNRISAMLRHVVSYDSHLNE